MAKADPGMHADGATATDGGSRSSRDRSIILEKLDDLGVEVIHWVDDTMCIARASLDVFREQDLNARYQPEEMFRQLTENIKSEGKLESMPYCVLTDTVEIVSGHHRMRALRASRYEGDVFFLLETR